MPDRIVHCAKLKQDLPGLDEKTAGGDQALRTCLLIGGRELRERVYDNISAQAWDMWKGQMIMIFNEFRLDPTSDEANKVLKQYMEAFFFGEQREIPNYVAPK